MVPELTAPLMAIGMEYRYTPFKMWLPFWHEIPLFERLIHLTANIIQGPNSPVTGDVIQQSLHQCKHIELLFSCSPHACCKKRYVMMTEKSHHASIFEVLRRCLYTIFISCNK